MTEDPILVVDDEADVRGALQELLQAQGYTAEVAGSGEEALRCMAGRDFSVVLTDLHMPGGLSGLELMSEIRQRHPQTLCILVTAFATLDTSIGALKQGAYDLIQKPFRFAEIEVVLNRALDHARLVRQVSAYGEELESRIASRTRELQLFQAEAQALCDFCLQGLEADEPAAALAPLLDRLEDRWRPDGLACYRTAAQGLLKAAVRRGPRPLPDYLDRPGAGRQEAAPNLGYPEERLVPLGQAGWLYLGFLERTTFSETEPGFLLLARHLEFLLRVR